MHSIKEILAGGSKFNQFGVYSVCSASDFVIEAALRRAKDTNTIALIEATANQVNQFGGYTGMRPADFAKKVYEIAHRVHIDKSQIVLGGDHLGPFPWRTEDESIAMQKSVDLVSAYVSAGFTKIHIDTSMRLGSDSIHEKPGDEVIAQRAAKLARAAMSSKLEGLDYVYVLGSEVPIPGGTQEAKSVCVSVTSPAEFKRTYECFCEVFRQNGLSDLWQDVVAFVVQPGVEFGETNISYYNRGKAQGLCDALAGAEYKGLCFEGHSTDYQPRARLCEMAADGIKILKVGPALTFYQREALFALEMLERELLDIDETAYSCFSQVLENAMLENPADWINYYHGDARQLKRMRQFSLSDRCRYYFSRAEVVGAVKKLIDNLNGIDIPLSVLSQYMPIQAELVNSGTIAPDARELVISRISNCIDDYLAAIGIV